MDVETENLDKYIIVPNKFIKWGRIDQVYFNDVKKNVEAKADDYRNIMTQKLKEIKKQRLKRWDWRLLYLIRLRVFLFGGIDLSGKSWKKH